MKRTIRTLGGEPVNIKQLHVSYGWPVAYICRALDADTPPQTMDALRGEVVRLMSIPQPKRAKSAISLRWNNCGNDSTLTTQAPAPPRRIIPPPRQSRRHSKDYA